VGTAVCHDFTAVVIGQRIVVLRTYGNVSEFFTEKITVTWLFYQLASRSASRQYMGSPSDSSLLEQSLAACGKIAMSFPLKIWTHTWFLGSTWVYTVYGISITSAIFAELAVCGCVYMSVMLEICKRPVWFGLVWFQFGVWQHHTLAASADQHSVVPVLAGTVGVVCRSYQAQHLAVTAHC